MTDDSDDALEYLRNARPHTSGLMTPAMRRELKQHVTDHRRIQLAIKAIDRIILSPSALPSAKVMAARSRPWLEELVKDLDLFRADRPH